MNNLRRIRQGHFRPRAGEQRTGRRSRLLNPSDLQIIWRSGVSGIIIDGQSLNHSSAARLFYETSLFFCR
jgi:hypothetical protein